MLKHIKWQVPAPIKRRIRRKQTSYPAGHLVDIRSKERLLCAEQEWETEKPREHNKAREKKNQSEYLYFSIGRLRWNWCSWCWSWLRPDAVLKFSLLSSINRNWIQIALLPKWYVTSDVNRVKTMDGRYKLELWRIKVSKQTCYIVIQATCNIKNRNISAASAAMVLLKTVSERSWCPIFILEKSG